MSYLDTLRTFSELQPGDRVEVIHQVKVGFRQWQCRTEGTVVTKDRRRHSLHFDRNPDDKVFSDILVLRKDDGELTTVALDEFTELKRLSAPSQSAAETAGTAAVSHES